MGNLGLLTRAERMTVATLPETPVKPTQRAPRGHITEDEWERAKMLRIAGKTWVEIASALQLNENSLKCKAHREKVPTLVATVREDVARIPEKRLSSSLAETSQRVRDLLSIDAESTAIRLGNYEPDNLRDEWQREQIAGSLVKRAAATFDWCQSQSSLVLNVGIMSQLPDSDQAQQVEPLDV